ncbi:hypothetical protein PPL_11430 [Heterostelium album PN500]|uniref:Ankyrin repeat protein n=1 Tax=Heterostelium pallidum (strain ATCC 26659 / Pp 5 / PN500) TaxID=670386 RepID=D3BTD6_HETP5|nr:hypothetical protein PPL_11430 [Heterostelium album PN500]EFA75353.1 hypothetical protein PPL_11430 [Heterostelium album PN500]|eukprot:XP_020427487.1 hypothetical protein PPL_11430 [Heterostelium album PN500]
MEKDKFLQIFNNIVLNKLIFKHVSSIHDVVYKGLEKFSWSELIKYPDKMAGNSYLNELKLYYTDHSITGDMYPTIEAAIKSGSFEILKYLVYLLKPISSSSLHQKVSFDDILKYAAEHGSLEKVKYICEEFSKKRLNYYNALMVAPLSGDIEIVKYLADKLENCGYSQSRKEGDINTDVTFDSAAKVGRIDIIEWLAEHRSEDRAGSNMYYGAINGGHHHIVQYLLDINEPRREEPHERYGTLFDYSIYCDQLEIAKLLHQHNIRASFGNLIDVAALDANLDKIKWLNDNTTVIATVEAMDNAAFKNNIEILKWLKQHRNEGCSHHGFLDACHKGYMEVAQWLWLNYHETIILEPSVAIDAAIGNGNLELAKWLFTDLNQRPSALGMDQVAINNYKHILKWLVDNSLFSFSTSAIDNLSRTGNLEMIKWLNEYDPSIGCTERAIHAAVYHGQFETMKWLRENRTEISSLKTINHRIYRGGAEAINWAWDNFEIDLDEMLNKAIIMNKSEEVEKIIKRNPSFILDNKHISNTFFKAKRDIIKFFHDNNTPGVFNDKSMESAIKGMQIPLVKWLYENRSDCQCTIDGFVVAIETGHMEMIEYLLSKHPEFANQLTKPKELLKHYFKKDDIEMIEFILDKINF